MTILLANISFYITAGVLVLICLLYIIFISVYYPLLCKSKVYKKINQIKEENHYDFELKKSKIDGSDFVLIKDNKRYLIKVLIVKAGCDLQINNIETFVIYNGNNNNGKGLSDMHTFMTSKQDNRILILSSQAKTIKKVINESEMIMVDSNTNIYNTKLINFNLIADWEKNL